MASPLYTPSGRIGASLLWRAPLTACLAVAGAWAYAWCAVRGHSILYIASPFVFGIFMVVLIHQLALGARVRNPYVMTMVGLAIGSLAWYANWIFWAGLHKGVPLTAMSWHPSAIHEAIRNPAIKSDMVGLWLAAALEYVTYAAFPALIGRGAAQSPFDEASGKWLDKVRLERRFEAIPESERPTFAATLERDPDGFISSLEDFPTDPARYTLLELYAAQGATCGYLSVEAVEETTRDGKVSKNSTTLIKHLRVSQDVAEMAQKELAAALPASATAAPGEVPTPRELEGAVQRMEAGNFEGALAAASPFCSSADPQLHLDANRVCALACSRLDRWAESAAYWQALFERERTAHNALQVATSMVMAGQLAAGEDWVAKAIGMNEEAGEVPPVMIYTNFITALKKHGYLTAALPYLEWVKALYQRLGCTDPTYLTMQGVPFLESFIEQSEPIVDASMDRTAARDWYASMLEHLDDAGKATLTSYLKDKRTI